MSGTVEKIDMSLDDIIKLNKRNLAASGRGGRGAGRGRGRGRGDARGRGGATGRGGANVRGGSTGRGGATGRGGGAGHRALRERRLSGISPLHRSDKKTTTYTRGRGRFIRGTSRGARGSRGGRGVARGLQRGQLTGLRRGNNYSRGQGAGAKYTPRGQGSKRGFNTRLSTANGSVVGSRSRGTRGVTRGRGRGRGGAMISQQKEAMVEVIRKAKRTLQQLNAQQKRQNLMAQKRGIPQVVVNRASEPQRKRQWRKRGGQRVQPQNQSLTDSTLVTVSFNNLNNSKNPQSQRGKRKKISQRLRQQVANTNSQSSTKSLNYSTAFSNDKTSYTLNQRFSGQTNQQPSAVQAGNRQVFF